MRTTHVLHVDCAGDDRAMMERRSDCSSAAQEGECHNCCQQAFHRRVPSQISQGGFLHGFDVPRIDARENAPGALNQA
jgi:hypothetical protein